MLCPPYSGTSSELSKDPALSSGKFARLEVFRACCAVESASYGGWEDLRLVNDSTHSGESAQLRKFLVSIGFDDKKYVLVFLLGLVSALVITRVRVSSIVIFPASVLIFGIGFSLGLARGGISSSSGVRVNGERFKGLVEFFDGLDARVNYLKNNVQKAIDCNKVALDDLQNYVREMELISSSASSARDALGTASSSNGVVTENIKSSKRKKDADRGLFQFLDFVGDVFGDKVIGLNSSKSKESKSNVVLTKEGGVKDYAREGVSSTVDEEKMFSSIRESNGKMNPGSSRFVPDDPTPYKDGDRERRTNLKATMDLDEVIKTSRGYSDREEFSYQADRFQFVNNQHVYMKTSRNYEARASRYRDNLLNFVDFSEDMKNMESEASLIEEQLLKKTSEMAYRSRQGRERSVNERYKSQQIEGNANSQEDFLSGNPHFEPEGDATTSSSSRISDDVVFDRYLTEANDLLKQAKEMVRRRHDEDHAQAILHKAAELLSRAIAMKPMSLLAVGQLGNTYLLHGELKLRISRDLRSLLSSNEPFSFDKQAGPLNNLEYNAPSKDRIASALMGVCEECEELLVEAGRKYRFALSIDGNDVRALYNWGLALSFRAQLIADIGPEAAFDADKVFLAAIDKFDAMMSKGNVYAPDALYRWGVALQQRSRLRPRNSREKVKLLEQAKRLYEDSLDMDSDNPRVREALSSCLSELNYRHF